MTLLCWTLKQHSLTVSQRSRLAVPGDELVACLQALSADGVQELVVVSTCQRFEIYLVSEAPERALAQISIWAKARADVEIAELHYGDAAAHHLFEVAAGLDSLTLGETEISGQLRRAWDVSRAQGLSADQLDPLFRQALAVGRRVRQGSGICRGAQSLESLTIETLAQDLSRPVAGLRWLILGAGQLGQSVWRQLRHRRAGEVRMINRSARPDLPNVEPWQALSEALTWADAILVCTAAPQPVLTRALWPTRKRPCAIADLALPANVEAGFERLAGLTLHSLEQLHQRLEGQQLQRGQSLEPARSQLETGWQEYLAWRSERTLAPFLAEIYAHVGQLPGNSLNLRQQIHPLVKALKQTGDPQTRLQQQNRLRQVLLDALVDDAA